MTSTYEARCFLEKMENYPEIVLLPLLVRTLAKAVCLKRTLSRTRVGDLDELTVWLISKEISTKTGGCFNRTCGMSLDPGSGWQVNCYRSLEKW